eukprot:CAMPEP_0179089504 /NCGR_PEP_ID=MMETSP0796-20121207/40786_1 /TAXON_ID=73915 /ORGANISM="Pyrodinium bahamense, Strain pbaha01" /LENGTH=44 /DNA_ID= /DNA_START= /DNA_END= /DNA_ORIENTATION=
MTHARSLTIFMQAQRVSETTMSVSSSSLGAILRMRAKRMKRRRR